MSLKFGTSGLRGLSVDLKGRAAAVYVSAFAHYLLQNGLARSGDPILVGRDFRDSSPEVSATAIGALKRAGLAPLDCGTVPTPALALYGLTLKTASLMVTGSHIPADRNGIKFYRPDGEIDKGDEIAIGAIAATIGDIDITPAEGRNVEAECAALFYERNISVLPPGALAGLTIGVYQHSTVARDLLVDVLTYYGANVLPLGRSQAFIPVDTEAVSQETVALLEGWAAQYNLDAVVSADGDGDRPLLADETGTPLRGDLLGLLTARFLGAEVVATPVTSNSGIEAAGGYAVARTRVGSPYVIAAMLEALTVGKKRVMGFEANGGLLTASSFIVNGRTLAPLPTRDSFLPLLVPLAVAAAEGKSISALAAGFQLPVAAADRLEDYPLEKSAALMTNLKSSRENLSAFLAGIGSVSDVSEIDGLRVSLSDGRTVHFRPSGNAPEMRCYVEAETEADAAALLSHALLLVKNFARLT